MTFLPILQIHVREGRTRLLFIPIEWSQTHNLRLDRFNLRKVSANYPSQRNLLYFCHLIYYEDVGLVKMWILETSKMRSCEWNISYQKKRTKQVQTGYHCLNRPILALPYYIPPWKTLWWPALSNQNLSPLFTLWNWRDKMHENVGPTTPPSTGFSKSPPTYKSISSTDLSISYPLISS